MTDDRKGGLALIAATASLIVTMALHPTGHDLLAANRFGLMAALAAGVHALAIASLPISFLGALALTRRLSGPDRLGVAALVIYGVALVAGLAAATVSGLVAPGLIARILESSPPESDGWRLLLHYNGDLNQAFARILVVASSTSIALWSIAMLKSRLLSRGMGVYGVVAGPVLVGAIASGRWPLDVHGFGLIVLIQAVWFFTVGVLLCRYRET